MRNMSVFINRSKTPILNYVQQTPEQHWRSRETFRRFSTFKLKETSEDFLSPKMTANYAPLLHL